MLARNEGATDRTIRVLVGLAILSMTVIGPKSMLGLIGLVPLMTGLVGYCPLYRLFGVRTCSLP